MELYHFSDGQYEKLIPQFGQNRTREEDTELCDKALVWLTNDKMWDKGKKYLYRYTVEVEEIDENLKEDRTVTCCVKGTSIENLRWYGYMKEITHVRRELNPCHSMYKVYQWSSEFREAIQNLTENEIRKSSEWFNKFPVGCCGDTSELLAKYLLSKEIETSYIWGMFQRKSHGWLMSGDYIIDITADQFEEISDSVILTKDNTWHSKFKNDHIKKEVFKDFNLPNRARLNEFYINIINKIPTDKFKI